MTELRKHDGDVNLARQYPVCVLITAPPDRALEIATAIADDDADLVVRKVHELTDIQQTALIRLLETETDEGPRRIIATSSTWLFHACRATSANRAPRASAHHRGL